MNEAFCRPARLFALVLSMIIAAVRSAAEGFWVPAGQARLALARSRTERLDPGC